MSRLLFETLKWSPSPYINRFLSADTIVPNPANPQNLNRYSYVTNNPLRYVDPSGHKPCEEYQGVCLSENQMTNIWNNTTSNGNGNNNNNNDGDEEEDNTPDLGSDKPVPSPDLMPGNDGSLCPSSFDNWCIYGGTVSTTDAAAIYYMYESYTSFNVALGIFGGALSFIGLEPIGGVIISIASAEGYNASLTASFFESVGEQAQVNGGQAIVVYHYTDQGNLVVEYAGNPVPSPVNSILVQQTLEGVLRWADHTVP